MACVAATGSGEVEGSMRRQASEGELLALRRPEDDWVVLKHVDVRCDGVPETVELFDCD